MKRHYFTLDVFTDEALSGNPLAVVLDSDGLETNQMQAIAGEFNLSETVFVMKPDDENNRARIRIFTPNHELPFAGHPTVGTAVLLATLDGSKDSSEFVLEETVGPVGCHVEVEKNSRSARFRLPKIPLQQAWDFDAEMLASALSLAEADLGFDNHQVSVWNGGLNYVIVPVRDMNAIGSIDVDTAKLAGVERTFGGDLADVYVYCRGGVSKTADFHARMFAPAHGIPEDPATGSAVASFCGQLAMCELESTAEKTFKIEQGYEMGRPSQIYLDVEKKDGTIKQAGIKGGAVIVSEGSLFV